MTARSASRWAARASTVALVTDTARNSYLGVEAGVIGATLIGIDGVNLTVSGTVLFNRATSASGATLSERVNWAAADTVPPGNLLPDFNTDANVAPVLDDSIRLLVYGEVNASMFDGFIVLDGTFTFVQATGSFAITDAGASPITTTVLSDVDYLSVAATVRSATISDVGFSNLELAMLMVSDGTATPVTYTAIKASLGAPELGALPEGLEISGSISLEVNVNSLGEDSDRVLDFVDTPTYAPDNGLAAPFEVLVAPGVTETLAMDGNAGRLVRISGSLSINVFGFLVLEGDFGFVNENGDFFVTAAGASPSTTAVENADYLLITGSVTTAFAGVPATHGGPIGFNLSGVEFALLVVTDPADGTTQYTTLKATVEDASFVGVDGLTVGVNTLSILVNRSSDAAHPNKVLDFAPTPFVPGTGSVTLDVDGNQGALLSASGDLTLDLFGFVSLSGNLGFTTANGDFKVARNTTAPIDDALEFSADYLVVSGEGIDAFAGSGGGTGNATGVSLSNVSFSLALVSNAGVGYTALKAQGSGGFSGVPGVDLSGDFFIRLNRNSLGSEDVIDFNAGGEVAGTPLGDIEFEGEDGALFEVGADSIQLALFDVLFVDAGFTFSQETVDVDVNGNGFFSATEHDLNDASMLKFSLTINTLFAGIPDANPFDAVVGGTGFSVQEGTLALAVIKATGAGDNRSFTAIKGNLTGSIQAVGLPDGLTATVDALRVALNFAEGTLPGVPSAIDWTDSVNEDGNSADNTSFAGQADAIQFRNGDGDVIETIGAGFQAGIVSIGGDFILNVFGYLRVDAGFDLSRQVVDVDLDGNDIADDVDASLLTLDLEISNFFIGVPGSVGVSIDEGSLTLAILDVVGASESSYTALMASLAGGALAGIPQLTINVVSLDFETNLADGGTPIDWRETIDLQPGAAAFDADDVMAGGTPVDPETFKLEGELNLSIAGGFVLAAGQFDIGIRNAQTEPGFVVDDGTIRIENANLLTVNLSEVFLFVGVNGAFEKDGASVIGLNTDDAIGFSVEDASLALAIVTGAAGTPKYTGIRAAVSTLAVHGLPDTFVFTVRDLVFLHNIPGNGTGLDWSALTAAGVVSGLQDVGSGVDLSVAGYLEIDINGLVLVGGRFSVARSTELIDDLSLPAFQASLLRVTLNNVHAFVGVNGGGFTRDPLTGDANGIITGADTVGIHFRDADLLVAIVGEKLAEDSEEQPRSWIGIGASLASVTTIGLPANVQISGKDFSFFYNQAAGTPAQRLDWQNISLFNGTLLDNLAKTTELFVAGYVLVRIDQFVYVSGAVTFEKRDLEVRTTNAAQVGTQAVSAFMIGAKTVKAFVGVGGPHFADADGLNNDGDTLTDERRSGGSCRPP